MIYTYIYIDLETTGLSIKNDEVVQIGAFKDTNHTYDRYIYPEKDFHPEASEVNKLTKDNGILLWNGNEVKTSSSEDAWKGLLDFLRGYENVVLVGHNMAAFDLEFIKRDLTKFNLFNKFKYYVRGFVDTLEMFKVILPNQSSYKQDAIAKHLNVEIIDAHNAIGDVITLHTIIQKLREKYNLSKFHMMDEYIQYLN